MNTFTLTTGLGRRGDYLLRDADGRSRGTLRVGWTLRRVQIQTTEGSFQVERRGWRRVTVVAGDDLLVGFSPDETTVPGPGPRPIWDASRERDGWRGSLRRAEAEIDVRLSSPGARQAHIDVTGDWEQLDLVVLSACFALILCQRRRAVLMTAGAH